MHLSLNNLTNSQDITKVGRTFKISTFLNTHKNTNTMGIHLSLHNFPLFKNSQQIQDSTKGSLKTNIKT